MICRMRGVAREQTDGGLVLDVHGVCYQIHVPPSILAQLGDAAANQQEIELVIYHYQQLEPSKGIPVLIGFLNLIEREFFERFITVSGVGPKAALKALAKPIPQIARAIDVGDIAFLRSLPGIGEQRAKEIVAKLQGKVGKFALILSKEGEPAATTEAPDALEDETIAILLQLGYRKPEAKEMIKAALGRRPAVKTAEELLNEIYRQRLHEQVAA
jgi:Holliday junction DNA helicase RuvA